MATQQLPQLQTEPRDRTGTRYARRLREAGRLPGVVYGHKKNNVPVSVDALVLKGILQSNAHLVEAVVDGKNEPCLIKDIQWNHLGSQIIHVDLARVDLAEEVSVEVVLELVGDPAALKEAGAVLDHPVSTLTVKCRADSIPEAITCDISELGVGESITVASLTLPAGVVIETDSDTVVAHIGIVAEIPEEEEMVEGEGEPEVIGTKDEAEGEGESEASEE